MNPPFSKDENNNIKAPNLTLNIGDLQEKISFLDIDYQKFQNKNRWSNFIDFSKTLQKSMLQKHENNIKNLLNNYLNQQSNGSISWINSTLLIEREKQITQDKNLSYASCFRNIQFHKSVLHIEDFSLFQQLESEFPNFKEVIQFYKGSFILNSSRDPKHYQAPRPILLLGNPGIGKTRFAKKLAQALQTNYKVLDANSITTGAVLTGHSAFWKASDAGLIFKTLASCSTLSPIIVFDEIDKLSIHKDYSPFSTFHQLLEPENSASIYDEFLELEFNASFIIYILTANNKHTIPESLLSRMTVIEIQNPDVQQMKIISQKIFIELLAGSQLFKEKLSEDVLNYLSQFSPREVYQILSKNLFQLSTNQRKKIKNDFFVIPEKKKEYKIGF